MISGPTITDDDQLISELKKNAQVITISNNEPIEEMLQNSRIDLILFEISHNNNHDARKIESIKNQFPDIPIIAMNGGGDNEAIAKAFSYGVIDAFKKPYKYYLIVERVNAIFRRL